MENVCAYQGKVLLQKYSHIAFTKMLGKIVAAPMLEIFICTVLSALAKRSWIALDEIQRQITQSMAGTSVPLSSPEIESLWNFFFEWGKSYEDKYLQSVFPHSLCSVLNKSCNFTCSVGNSCWENSFLTWFACYPSCLAPQYITYNSLELSYACQCKLTIYTTRLIWEPVICLATLHP